MRYLQSFNRRLRQLREERRLSCWDIAQICNVDEPVVQGWEASDPRQRRYPGVVELLDLCLKTETALESLLDLDPLGDSGQLELPGLAFSNTDDLTKALRELEREIDRVRLSEDEAELLRRFRKSSSENRRMVLQILGR
jgi:hypothetical protein